jgi:deazaflavin-dependent oxidoreductase (nitroreductase family)
MSTIDQHRPLGPGGAERHGAGAVRTRSLVWRLARWTTPLGARLSGSRLFPLYAVVEHRGRRSGRAYATPVVARRTIDGFVIPLPFGEDADWARNVRSAGGCSIWWKGRRYEVDRPEVVGRTIAAPAFSRVQRALMGPTGIDRFLRVRDAET